jgi:hypothetical protein
MIIINNFKMYNFYRKHLFHLTNSELELLIEELEEHFGPLKKKENEQS